MPGERTAGGSEISHTRSCHLCLCAFGDLLQASCDIRGQNGKIFESQPELSSFCLLSAEIVCFLVDTIGKSNKDRYRSAELPARETAYCPSATARPHPGDSAASL